MSFVNEQLQFIRVGETHPYVDVISRRPATLDDVETWVTTFRNCEIVCVGRSGWYASWEVVEGTESEPFDVIGFLRSPTSDIVTRRMSTKNQSDRLAHTAPRNVAWGLSAQQEGTR